MSKVPVSRKLYKRVKSTNKKWMNRNYKHTKGAFGGVVKKRQGKYKTLKVVPRSKRGKNSNYCGVENDDG